jgi:hypothetical protein
MALSKVDAPGSAVTVYRPRPSMWDGPFPPPEADRFRSDIVRLEEHVDVGRHVVGDKSGYADPKIDEHAGAQFLGDAFGYDRLSIHIVTRSRRGSRQEVLA